MFKDDNNNNNIKINKTSLNKAKYKKIKNKLN